MSQKNNMIGLPESMAMVCMYFSDPPVLREATRRSEVILLYFSNEYLPERQCILSLLPLFTEECVNKCIIIV